MLACYALSCDSSDVIVITAYELIPLVLTWLADHEHLKKKQLEEKLKSLSEVIEDDDTEKQTIDAQVEPSWFTLAKKNISSPFLLRRSLVRLFTQIITISEKFVGS